MNAVAHPSTVPFAKDGNCATLDAAAVLMARQFHGTIISADELIAIFDGVTDTLFFLKDVLGRYTHVNSTMASRLGLKHRGDAIGHTAAELYPAIMSDAYVEQDRRVLQGEIIENLLEVQLFPNRAPGWCLTRKRPLRMDGAICGLIGISRDIGQHPSREPVYVRLRAAVETIQRHFTENLRVRSLANEAGMSLLQLERHFKRVFRLTPQQMLTKLRIEHAMLLLHGRGSVASIGQACGFADQSAFTRQFKATTGMTPRTYRSALTGCVPGAQRTDQSARTAADAVAPRSSSSATDQAPYQ